jgi:cobyrinic acid a,c-diamide synthase
MYPFHSKPPGLMIAAPRSGSGKTMITLGLLRALSRRGLSVQPFKCGPDYIDPAFHKAACGRPSYNLDSWAMRKETVLSLLDETNCADFAIAEALMGLFDGVASTGAWGNGSSASLAALAGWPVVLVLDISGQSQTAAAAARGFVNFSRGVEIAGAILNRVASTRHEKLARAEFQRIGMRVFGAIPRRTAIELPERHLGLVQANETEGLQARLDALADLAEAHLEIDALLDPHSSQSPPASSASRICDSEQPQPQTDAREGYRSSQGNWAGMRGDFPPPGQRIAIAQDAAFSFLYPHLMKAWRSAGAEVLPFSPLADQAPDQSADAVWLPGGYPELHAGRLASNEDFLAGVRSFAVQKPVHGECGGYMVLGAGLIDEKGERHAMLGLLGLEVSFAVRKLQLGYRRAELLADCVLGRRGEIVAGHEFHYSTILAETGEKLFKVADAEGTQLAGTGLRQGKVTGSFFHFVDKWS